MVGAAASAWEFEGDFGADARSSRRDDPVAALVRRAQERERGGIAPNAVVGELLALGRVYERRGDAEARARVDAAVERYVAHVTGRLSERARRDSLTGLLNHAAFHSQLAAETARAQRYNGRLALALFDLDRFKETNDRAGHQEGDRLLREFARALAATVRESDAVGRLGGDEFGALLLETEPKRLAAFLDRLYARLPPEIAVSAGAAFFPTESSSPEQLVALADRRLYAHKAARAA
jgi:diguanylate cyclase (GGDEF)-like protein